MNIYKVTVVIGNTYQCEIVADSIEEARELALETDEDEMYNLEEPTTVVSECYAVVRKARLIK